MRSESVGTYPESEVVIMPSEELFLTSPVFARCTYFLIGFLLKMSLLIIAVDLRIP